ncbi:MAG: hypothetical protein FJ104_08560, partial [Deltaproteobacteria bacterium]|nr:hypothetical protein [Deltaproteobacteria bacterium]
MAERPAPHPRPERAPDDVELSELPPAVICVVCGRADCAGHDAAPVREGTVRPAWEEPDAPWLGSAWATARAVTVDATRFFGSLSTGSVTQALGFALLVELAAIGSLALSALGALGALLPDALQVIARTPEDRATLGLALGLGIPGMA